MSSLQGRFLVASPHLGDANFFRTVVFLLHHDSEGAFGLVLNRPLSMTAEEQWDELVGTEYNFDGPLYSGGPVPGPPLALHNSRAHSDEEVLPGVHLASRSELLDTLVQNPPDQFRLFTGYAGWGAGQLEQELEVGGWLQADAAFTDIFADADEIWSKLTRRINLEIVAGSLDSRFVPDDASMN